MSVSYTPRRIGHSRILWRLRRPFCWSWPPGWGWEGPDASGRTMTLRGAYRAMRRAEREHRG
jgi:hypothetical protein